MTGILYMQFSRLVPESVKNLVAEKSRSRVVALERETLEDVAHAFLVFAADIEAAVRDADQRVARLLDSTDVRMALIDLRARVESFRRNLDRGSVGAEAVLEFVATARDLGVGGVKAASTPDDVADAVSRAVDHLEGYLLARGHLLDQSVDLRRVEPSEVRKVAAEVRMGDLVWTTQFSEGAMRTVARGAQSGTTVA